MKTKLLLLLVLLLFIQVSVHAQPQKPTEGEMSSEPSHGWIDHKKTEGISGILSGDDLISSWGNSIVSVDGAIGKIWIEGYTSTYNTVSYLSLTLYVQRWDSGTSSWVNIQSNFYSKTMSSFHTVGTHTYVSPGYYYRVRSVHFASHGALSETLIAISSYIYVG